MRDGVHLDTDVLRPKSVSAKLPTVLVRTPYEKVHGEWSMERGFLEMYLNHGYAVVLQNERGRYSSEGKFENFLQGASTDGYNTAQWIISQPWSNGKIGTIGCSSSSETQWPMAASNPPGYAAMIPMASGMAVGNIPGNATRGANYRGGVPVLDVWPVWYASMVPAEQYQLPANSSHEQRIRMRNTFAPIPMNKFFDRDPQLLMHLPSKDIMRNAGAVSSPLDNYLTWEPADERWNAVEHISAGAAPRVPALIIDTWHDDLGAVETTRLFK